MKKKLIALSAAFLLATGTVTVTSAHAEPTTTETTAQGSHGGATHEGKEGAAHEGEHEEGPPGEINWTDFSKKGQPAFVALAINFIGLVLLLYFMFRKGVTTGLAERKVTIAKDIESAQGMLSDAKERAKRYQAKLQDVEADAEQAKAALVATGEGEKAAIAKAAEEKVERMKRDADFMVSQETKQLQKDLLRETVEAAIKDAEDMIAKGISQTDQERLAEEFLGSLQTQLPSARSSSASGAGGAA